MAGEANEIYSLARQTVVGRVYCFFFNHNLLLGHLLCKGCVVCVVIPIYTIVVITSYLARLHLISSASTGDHQRVCDFNSIIYLLDWIKRETGGKGSDTWLLKTSNYVCVTSVK